MSQTGCRPTESPTSFGDRMLPSTNWPKTKIPNVARIIVQSGQNCTMATPMDTIRPVSEPT
jgi:hypothetical protein